MKRNIFDELVEGFDALAQEREGRLALHSHTVQVKDLPAVTSEELISLRERLDMSRPVFAMYLRINPRTLESWEQGRAKPNAQATTLIRLIEKHPETIGHLATLN
jgi:putative transcriptional regulator